MLVWKNTYDNITESQRNTYDVKAGEKSQYRKESIKITDDNKYHNTS
jgi:hypothetical protein